MLKKQVASIDKIEYIESPLNIIERLCCFVFLCLVQTLCKPQARKNDSAALIFLSLVQTLCKPQARKNGSGNAGRPQCVADPHIPREGQPQ